MSSDHTVVGEVRVWACGAGAPAGRDEVGPAPRGVLGLPVSGAAMSARTWALVVPACEWLSSNSRLRPVQVAGEVRLWRQAVYVACQRAKLPTGITPVRITAVAHYVGRPPVRDRLNLAPTIKACIDGLGPARTLHRNGRPTVRTVGYGFLPDDSDEHVLDTTWVLEQTLGQPRVELFLTHEPAVADG